MQQPLKQLFCCCRLSGNESQAEPTSSCLIKYCHYEHSLNASGDNGLIFEATCQLTINPEGDFIKASLPAEASMLCHIGADLTRQYLEKKKTQLPLFPWPNESLINNDMCDAAERQSDWCLANNSLTTSIMDSVNQKTEEWNHH